MGKIYLYHITMGTGLALAVDKNQTAAGSTLIITNPNKNDPDQQWVFLFDPTEQASLIYNPHREMFAVPRTISKEAPVIILPISSTKPTRSTTWQILGPKKEAIRPPADTGLNLNALGPTWPAGTKVGIWTWGGGAPNEAWTSTLLGS